MYAWRFVRIARSAAEIYIIKMKFDFFDHKKLLPLANPLANPDVILHTNIFGRHIGHHDVYKVIGPGIRISHTSRSRQYTIFYAPEHKKKTLYVIFCIFLCYYDT